MADHSTPLISIVVPIYNVEEYVEDCLRSILSQSYKNIEVICVDDCGHDSSIEKVEYFAHADSRIKIINHNSNKGLGPARNTGIEASSGEYIIFLDSDDMFYPDALEKILNEATRTGAEVTVGRVIAFPHRDDSKSKLFAASYNSYDSETPSGTYRLKIGDFSSPCRKLSVVSHGRLFSASFLKREKLRFINQNVVHEDNGFYCKYMSCLPLVTITDIPTVQYRIRPSSIMTSLDSQNFANRREQHIRLALEDARLYIIARHDNKHVEGLLYTLGCLESPPFIFNYGRMFQLQWGKYAKCIRILGLSLYRERINSKGEKLCLVLGCVVWKNKVRLEDR